jgi:16S rRNA (uracil1498-N3)-methyltransferase
VTNLFFTNKLTDSKFHFLDGDEAHHAIKVLRLGIGNILKISDGKSYWVEGPIVGIAKRKLTVEEKRNGVITLPTPELVLVQALTKSDRTKEMLELVTVSGVDRIIPWASNRTISRWQKDSQNKWFQTMQEACKQSKRVRIPVIDNLISTRQLCNELMSSYTVIFHESAPTKFSEIAIPSNLERIYIVIGPEGGLAEEEIESFKATGSTITRLGEPILRSAHAGFAALSAVQTKIGRW